MKCVIPCINISHCSLQVCGVSSTGAIALGKGLQENNSLEELEYVTSTLIETNSKLLKAVFVHYRGLVLEGYVHVINSVLPCALTS